MLQDKDIKLLDSLYLNDLNKTQIKPVLEDFLINDKLKIKIPILDNELELDYYYRISTTSLQKEICHLQEMAGISQYDRENFTPLFVNTELQIATDQADIHFSVDNSDAINKIFSHMSKDELLKFIVDEINVHEYMSDEQCTRVMIWNLLIDVANDRSQKLPIREREYDPIITPESFNKFDVIKPQLDLFDQNEDKIVSLELKEAESPNKVESTDLQLEVFTQLKEAKTVANLSVNYNLIQTEIHSYYSEIKDMIGINGTYLLKQKLSIPCLIDFRTPTQFEYLKRIKQFLRLVHLCANKAVYKFESIDEIPLGRLYSNGTFEYDQRMKNIIEKVMLSEELTSSDISYIHKIYSNHDIIMGIRMEATQLDIKPVLSVKKDFYVDGSEELFTNSIPLPDFNCSDFE